MLPIFAFLDHVKTIVRFSNIIYICSNILWARQSMNILIHILIAGLQKSITKTVKWRKDQSNEKFINNIFSEEMIKYKHKTKSMSKAFTNMHSESLLLL